MKSILLFIFLGILYNLKSAENDSTCVNFEEKVYLNSFMNKTVNFSEVNENNSCNLDDETLLYKEASYLFKHKMYNEALEIFNQLQVSKTFTEKSKLAYSIGSVYYSLNNFEAAIQSYKKCNLDSGLKIDANFYIAQSFNNLNEYDSSTYYYNKVIALQPNSTSSWNNIGYNYELKNEYFKSLFYYVKADSLAKGNNPLYQSNIIQSLKQNDKLDEAIEYAEKAYSKYPDHVRIVDKYASVYNKLGEHRKAIQITQVLLKKLPNEPDLNFRMGYSYNNIGSIDSALIYYYKDVKYGVNRPWALHNISLIYRSLGEFELALKFINRAVDVDPQHKNSRHGLVNLYIWMHEYELAYEALENYFKLFGFNESEDNNFKGYSLMLINKFEDAIPFLEKEIRINPGKSRAFNNLGRCFAKLGEYEKADSLFHVAIGINNSNSFIYHNRASMYYDMGKYEEACANLKLAIDYEYNWVIDSSLYDLNKTFCTDINLKRKIVIHGYKGAYKNYSNINFIELVERSELELESLDTIIAEESFSIDFKEKNNSIQENNRFNLYPNPTSGLIKFDFNEQLTSIKIFDLKGNRILTKMVNGLNSVDFDLSSYPVGQYLLIASNATEVKFTTTIILTK